MNVAVKNQNEYEKYAVYIAEKGTASERKILLDNIEKTRNFDIIPKIVNEFASHSVIREDIKVVRITEEQKLDYENVVNLLNFIIENRPEILTEKVGDGIVANAFIQTVAEHNLMSYIANNKSVDYFSLGKGSDNFAYKLSEKGSDQDVIIMLNLLKDPEILRIEGETKHRELGEDEKDYTDYSVKTHVINILAERTNVIPALLDYIEKNNRADLLKLEKEEKTHEHTNSYENIFYEKVPTTDVYTTSTTSAIQSILVNGNTDSIIKLFDLLKKNNDIQTLEEIVPEFIYSLGARGPFLACYKEHRVKDIVMKILDVLENTDPTILNLEIVRKISVEKTAEYFTPIEKPFSLLFAKTKEDIDRGGRTVAEAITELASRLTTDQEELEIQRKLVEMAKDNRVYRSVHDALKVYGYEETKKELEEQTDKMMKGLLRK